MPQNTAITTSSELAKPFATSDEHTDLVIRTSDRIHFYVVKLFLSYASPFFHNLFADGISAETHRGFPILDVEEDCPTFRLILLLCYPHALTEFKFDKLASVMRGIEKYCMDNAQARLESFLVNHSQTHPQSTSPLPLLRVYGLAQNFGYRALYLELARRSITEGLGSAEAQAAVTGADYRALAVLQLYRQQVHKAARSVVLTNTLVTSLTRPRVIFEAGMRTGWRLVGLDSVLSDRPTCGRCGADLSGVNFRVYTGTRNEKYYEHYVHGWLKQHVDRIVYSSVPRPPLESLHMGTIQLALNQCHGTQISAVKDLLDLLDVKIETAIGEVALESMM